MMPELVWTGGEGGESGHIGEFLDLFLISEPSEGSHTFVFFPAGGFVTGLDNNGFYL